MAHGELFAGISGFGLGFEPHGLRTTWRVENDKYCQAVLRYHYPDDPLLSDVNDRGAYNLTPVDVISFGSPCQGLSVAGKRKGLSDDRSNLFFQAIRIISELEPTFAIWENVPGALSSNAGRDFAAVLTAFRYVGARDIAWRVLDAYYFGVPQRRRRIFLVADFRRERAAEILFESEMLSGRPAPQRGQAAAALAQDRAGNGSQPVVFQQNMRWEVRGSLTHTAALAAENGSNQQNYVVAFTSDRDGVDAQINFAPTLKHGGDQPQAHNHASKTAVVAFDWQSGGSPRLNVSTAHTSAQQASQVPAIFSMTIPPRRLTPKERERLQGFPDDWTRFGLTPDGRTIEISDTQRYRMTGNAVAVPVARWLASRIHKLL